MRTHLAWTLVGAVALAAGCDETPDGTLIDEPTPWIYEDDGSDTVPPSLDAVAVAEAIEDSLGTLFDVNPAPVQDVFVDALDDRDDGGCPFVYETVDGYAAVTFWQDSCAASTGAMYEGYGYMYVYDDYPAGDDLLLDGWAILLSGEVGGAGGDTVEGSGVVSEIWGSNGYYDYRQRQLGGTFVIDGRLLDASGVDWLDGSLQPNFDVSALYVPEINPDAPTGLDARQVSINGAFSGLAGDVETVAFEGVIVTEETVGSACDLEPAGTISVRAADGNWYDVVFDAPAELGEPMDDPSLCDGCGTAWFRGDQIEDVCVDFTRLLDWEGAPW